ncbi:MAG TPA: hypothetical protein VGA01_06765, partial [Candidatus Binatia bacterium]
RRSHGTRGSTVSLVTLISVNDCFLLIENLRVANLAACQTLSPKTHPSAVKPNISLACDTPKLLARKIGHGE